MLFIIQLIDFEVDRQEKPAIARIESLNLSGSIRVLQIMQSIIYKPRDYVSNPGAFD